MNSNSLAATAEAIVLIIADYEATNGITIDAEHVLRWAQQFEKEDREFLLNELSNILTKTYFSKNRVLDCLFEHATQLAKHLKYRDIHSFFLNSSYISTQGEEKSQTEILQLFYQKIEQRLGLKKQHIGSQSKANIIYFDDVLATGKTTFKELKGWLGNISRKGVNYHELLADGQFRFFVFYICCHQWGLANVDYQIKQEFGEPVRKQITYHHSYSIENHLKSFNPKLNLVYPIDQKNEVVNTYFDNIDTGGYQKYANLAYRKPTLPKVEQLFTSPENRIRYENILLLKGIEILNSVSKLKSKELRPLGYTVRSHKTFGIGTQFFTFRNISNTTPLVFWWENHGWYPLFPVKNRGL